MNEDIIKQLASAKNNRYVFLFNITDNDGNFIGNYSLQKGKNCEISLVRNDIYDNGKRENRKATYKLTKNDKFTLETIDYMTSEMIDAKDLIDFYDLLKTNDDLYHRNLDDLNVKTYIVHSKKHDGYNYNHFRENIYNSKNMAYIAEQQLKRNINGFQGGIMSPDDPLISSIKDKMSEIVLNNIETNNLFFNLAVGKPIKQEEKTPYDNSITIKYDQYIMDKLLNYDNFYKTKEKYLNDELGQYINFRDTFKLITKYRQILKNREKQMAAQKGETVEEKPIERAVPVVEESFKPKVKQLTLYDLIDPKKYKKK